MLVNKQNFKQNFYHLFGELKKTTKKNNNVFFFKTNNNHKIILQLLQREGYILSYQTFNNFLIIKLKNNGSTKNTHLLHLFASIEKPMRLKQKNFTISISELVKLHRREGNLTTYLLNTDKGLLTSQEAISKHLGGKIILKIT